MPNEREDSKSVTIQEFPTDKLEQIRTSARENGVRDSDASAVKWAAIQWVLQTTKQQITSS